MRICFFIPSLGDGGAQRQCIALLNELQQDQAVELHLILLGRGEHEDSLDLSGLSVHRTEVDNFASPNALLFVIRTLRRVRPDLVISWLHPADIWAYAATRIVRGIPWIITERGSIYPNSLVFNLRKMVGRRSAAAIIANSKAGEQVWRALHPQADVQVIPNIVIKSGSKAAPLVDSAASIGCLYVGRLEPEKNVDIAVAAFAKFSQTTPDARFIIVGKGSQAERISLLLAELGIADRVDMLGFRKDAALLMSRARIIISLSRYEGMPNVLMEAVDADLPAVVSDIAEHRALLGDDYPYFAPLGGPIDATADIITSAWADGAARSAQNYAHAREVLAHSKPEMIAKAYVGAFAEVIAHQRTPLNRRENSVEGDSRL